MTLFGVKFDKIDLIFIIMAAVSAAGLAYVIAVAWLL